MPLFLPVLKQQGHLNPIYLTICSVGSRKVTSYHDFGSQTWGIFAPNLTICGFDADTDACDAANADLDKRQINWMERHFPFAIANQIGTTTLHVTHDPQCSSLYPPNEPFLKRFVGLQELAGLEFTVEIETTTLDAAAEEVGLQNIDFLQIDVQGANLQVLQGASQLLQGVLGIQVEVEFSELYLGQPLFADVDQFLRDQGFSLLDLCTLAKRSKGPVSSVQRPGQILWTDAIYLRDPWQNDPQGLLEKPDQLLKLACIADGLELTDYALEILESVTVNYGAQPLYNLADAILASLNRVPDIVNAGIENVPSIQKLQSFLTQPISPETVPESSSEAAIKTSETQSRTQSGTQEESFNSTTVVSSFALPIDAFHTDLYLRNTHRRLEHLASLGLDLLDRSVLEVGAGIGDHTSFFLDRNCSVLCTEGRPDNLEVLEQRFPDLPIRLLDLNDPDPTFSGEFEIVYCYGLLYHLHKPGDAIAFMAAHCSQLLLLETCVSFGDEEAINFCQEPSASPTQSISGQGCRPARSWVFNQLKRHFPYVYMPITQPTHEEFPLDWNHPATNPATNSGRSRSIFIASRQPLNNPLLAEEIPLKQRY